MSQSIETKIAGISHNQEVARKVNFNEYNHEQQLKLKLCIAIAKMFTNQKDRKRNPKPNIKAITKHYPQ